MVRHVLAAALIALAAPAFAATEGGARATETLAGTLTVSVASSLNEAMAEVAKVYETRTGTRIVLNAGASGALSQQILRGAPVDLFVAAAAKPMDELERAGRIVPGTRSVLAMNSVVLVEPSGRTEGLRSFAGLGSERLRRIAVGEPTSVPLGQYASEIFAALDLTAAVASKLVYAQSARQVLTLVETGNVDAGVVYATDVRGATAVRVVAEANPRWHSPVVYLQAVVKRPQSSESARRFAGFLAGPEAGAVLARFGFRRPAGPS